MKAYLAALPVIIKRDFERRTYQVYVTDALQAIAENTAVSASYYSGGKEGKVMTRRLADLDKPMPPEGKRTPDEVIEHMKQICMEVAS